MLEAARSQIAGTVSQTEVQNLPLNGRNFLDLALLVPGVSPTNVGGTQLFPETSAVPGPGISVGSQRNLSNNFIVDGLSANDDAAGLSGISYSVDAVAEFQVVTSGGQAELGRALGGYINVITKSGTNASPRRPVRLLPRRALQRAERALRHQAPDDAGAVRGEPRRPHRPRPDLLLRELRAPQPGPDRPRHHLARQRRRHQRPAGRGRLPGAADLDRASTRSRSTPPTSWPRSITSSARRTGSASATACTTSTPTNSRNVGRPERPQHVHRPGQHRPDLRAQQRRSSSPPRTVNETRAQFAYSDLKAPPTDPVGPAVSIAGRGLLRDVLGQPHRAPEQDVPARRTTSPTRRARTPSGRAWTSCTTTTPSPIPRSVRGSYTFSSLANFLAGTYNNAGFTQTFGTSVVSQTNPNLGLYAQDEWKVSPRLTLNAGLRYDLQFLETIDTGHEQRLAAPGLRLVALRVAADARARRRRALLRPRPPARRRQRAAVGREHDGPRQPAADRRQPVPDAGRRARFPDILGGVVPIVHPGQLHDHGPRPAERPLPPGQRRDRAAARRARHGQRRLRVPARPAT